MSTEQKKIIVITGPTATGKTAVGAALARVLGGEVISADSMQIYRRMDIGTAKPGPGEMLGIPHHLMDVAEPSENWSAARWTAAASACADRILAEGKIPVVVGGTGLWIESLLAGRDFAAPPANTGVRERLNAQYDALGALAMAEKLRAIDPDRAAKLSPADKKRVVRALEVFELTGETITRHDRESRLGPARYESLRFALTWRERSALYARINTRAELMVQAGLFEETGALLREGLPPGCTAMQAIGYKEAAAALRGECTREEALEMIQRESRRYAKRQLTWLRRDPGLRWIEREDAPETEDVLFIILREWHRGKQLAGSLPPNTGETI